MTEWFRVSRLLRTKRMMRDVAGQGPPEVPLITGDDEWQMTKTTNEHKQ